MQPDVHAAALAVVLEYAKRGPTAAQQERFYTLLQELIDAAGAAGALEYATEEQRALLKAAGVNW